MALNKLNNLLPYDGTVLYLGPIMPATEADEYFDLLFKDIQWQQDEAFLFGKHYKTKRKVAWYANKSYSYTYSNVTKIAHPWTKALEALKVLTEHHSNSSYNACLLNLYHDGQESMAWHSDGEKMLKAKAPIASLSFGAERKFAFKHKQTKEVVSLILEQGSLLLMMGETQQHWLHRLPPTKKIHQPRINLTYRTISEESPV